MNLAAGIWTPALLTAGATGSAWLSLQAGGGALLAAGISTGWVLLALAYGVHSWHRRCAPVERITEAVVSAGNDNGTTVAIEQGELIEFQALRHAINDAFACSREETLALRQQVESMASEIDRKKTEIESAKRSRARFLAAASHDLRQPLSALMLLTSTLAQGERDQARQSRIEHVRQCADSLNRLFGALLDLSRLESGDMVPRQGVIALDSLFDEVSRTFRISAEQRHLRLVVRKTEAFVRCDRIMLSRILNNLVSNAIRYTRSGGVLVGARVHGRRIRIDVWDTGPGISAEAREHVFEEFFRAHHAPAQGPETQGFGLGLATVRRLCDVLAVPIRLESRVDRGTLFSLEVPLVDAADGDHPAAPADQPLDVSGLRALVIDDEPAILLAMRALLEDWGCEVDTAADAATAARLARVASRAPDIVISDLQLGGRHGGVEIVRMLERIYADKRSTGIARLLITGETRHEDLRDLATARIPVLFKPVSPERLREAIMATIANGRVADTRAPDHFLH